MQVCALLFVLAADVSFGLRIARFDWDQIDAKSEEAYQKEGTGLQSIFRRDGKMALDHLVDIGLPSSLKVVQTNAYGEHELLEVFLQPLSDAHKVMLDVDKNPTISLPGGFTFKKSSGDFKGGASKFINMLLTNLTTTKLNALQKCGAQLSAVPGTGGPSGVWLVLNGEKIGPEFLENSLAFNNNKVLILGAPGRDVASGKGRSIYIPGASLSFMEMSRHTPMDLINRQTKPKEEGRVLAYQHKNCKATREQFFSKMCEGLHSAGMKCYALGACGHNQYAEIDNRNNAGGRSVANRDEKSAERYATYKFAEAFENSAGIPSTVSYSSSGYITEKIMSAFLAGAIPVYAGGINPSEVFNPAAFIEADPLHDPTLAGAVAQMVNLERNPEKYQAMVNADAVSPAQMEKFFSWHPATWPTHGDSLRMKIVDTLLSMCEH